jgi:nicotinamidase-related amidase
MDRSTVNAWDYEPFVEAVKATGRDHLIIAGLSFEVCASLPAISAKEEGFQPVVALEPAARSGPPSAKPASRPCKRWASRFPTTPP